MKKLLILSCIAAFLASCASTNLQDKNGNIVAVVKDKKKNEEGKIVGERPVDVYGYKTTDAELEETASSHFNSKFTLEKKEIMYKGLEEGNVFLLSGTLENGELVILELPAKVTRKGIVLK